MHNVEYYTYARNVDKKKVEARLNDYVAHADWEEGCTGLDRPIRWLDSNVYENEQKAREAIEKLDEGWYDQLAVLYKEYYPPKDKKQFEITHRKNEARKEYDRRAGIIYASTVTAAFIGCKECGSKLARTLLRSNKCPVCGKELRPEHMLKSVEAAKNKWKRILAEEDEYIRKHGKSEVQWIVKIEYHT